MPLGNATQQVQYFILKDPSDMMKCLEFLPKIGYRGDLSTWADPDDDKKEVWALVINDFTNHRSTQQNMEARLGKVVVWDNINIHIISNDEFVREYTKHS